ncbi:pyrroline-5-carboxylate reductase [Sphaeroforma arctica JP610]|uniref:Pyrroline-5-carboxylate reductase n=1 Tax=Sphaeroforma arctica JP610 TaxID=667725 RepID=A0A0L0FWM4_9EUKA|nr:pyrroline-5-carboxylate reductase [Sphaeroforma arctica JP610]KNC81039.1 pyrroline-5-carboxylate reductase [Sphaeroforma arctica JP610]|eukprot:XP_014154941.1 pyrroline-5-carboxylate reductase [Sphaeroforma arctica JP610]
MSAALKTAGTLAPTTCRRLTMIGAGRMAEALINGIISKEALPADQVVVYDINAKVSANISKKYGCVASNSMLDAITDSDVVILAVKPNNVTDVGKVIASALSPKTTVVSVMAGVNMNTLSTTLNHRRIVRAMSNTPAFISQGMTVWTGSQECTQENKDTVQQFFAAVGEEIYVSEEKYLDMATAISGSGPAYVMLMMEALTDSGVHLGFPRDVAKKLAQQTLLGTTMYSINSDEIHLAKLRNDVTSPGGTTATALYELEAGGFRTVMSKAVWAAYRRALELGGSDSNVGPGRSHG